MTIIGFTVAVLVIGLGAAWFFLEFRGAQRNNQIGDELVAEGTYKFAIKQYGRAIDKEATNLEYVKKMRDTLSLITPATPSEADSFWKQYLSTLKYEARYDPLDIDKQLRVVEEMFHAAHMTGAAAYWSMVEAASNMGLDRILPDDPRRHEQGAEDAAEQHHLEDVYAGRHLTHRRHGQGEQDARHGHEHRGADGAEKLFETARKRGEESHGNLIGCRPAPFQFATAKDRTWRLEIPPVLA